MKQVKGKKWLWVGGLAVAISVVAVVYYRINPTDSRFMPFCVFHKLTGWQCPACGNQRALHALLHGEFLSAFAFNPFLFLSLPYLFAIIYATIFDSKTAKKVRNITHHRITILIYLALTVLWWIGRNIW